MSDDQPTTPVEFTELELATHYVLTSLEEAECAVGFGDDWDFEVARQKDILTVDGRKFQIQIIPID